MAQAEEWWYVGEAGSEKLERERESDGQAVGE